MIPTLHEAQIELDQVPQKCLSVQNTHTYTTLERDVNLLFETF